MTEILYLAGFAIVVAILIFFATDNHTWHYHNPYDRRCQTCGRHEVSHCRSLDSWNRSWWVVFDEGDGSCTNKGKEQNHE